MTFAAGSPNGLGRVARAWPRLRWPAAVAAWLALALIVVIGIVGVGNLLATRLHVTRELSGTVTLVNHDGSAFCLDPDGSGDQFCSAPYQLVGSAALVVGERVTGTIAELPIGPSMTMEVFIVTDPHPTP